MGGIGRLIKFRKKLNPYTGLIPVLGGGIRISHYRYYGFSAQAPLFAPGLNPRSFASPNSDPIYSERQAQKILALNAVQDFFIMSHFTIMVLWLSLLAPQLFNQIMDSLAVERS